MHTHLFDRVNIRPDYSFIPDGTCEDSEFECRRYENQIRSLGGIDMQLLGLGRNGHIGFNEPSDTASGIHNGYRNYPSGKEDPSCSKW